MAEGASAAVMAKPLSTTATSAIDRQGELRGQKLRVTFSITLRGRA